MRNRTVVLLSVLAAANILALSALKILADRRAQPPRASSSFSTSGYYSRRLAGTTYQITRKFYDFRNELVTVTFPVDLADYRKSVTEFGLVRAKISDTIISALKRVTSDYIAKKKLKLTIAFQSGPDGEVEWRYQYRYATPTERQSIEDLIAALPELYEKAARALYKKYGYRRAHSGVEGDDVLMPDYGWLVEKNLPRLRKAYDALYRAGRLSGAGERDFLGMTLAFCQEIPYKNPPEETNGRLISGVLPPTQTVVENWGDCDCKSVLFASLWDQFREDSVVLVYVPNHIFAAVKGRPLFSTDRTLDIDGATYVCVEPVGPGKIPPGELSDYSLSHFEAGNFDIHAGY